MSQLATRQLLRYAKDILGFRTLNQAQLLSDALYYNDSIDAQQWLLYYISKPLIGTPEPMAVTIATLPGLSTPKSKVADITKPESSAASVIANKKPMNSFNDVLNHFPMIARQLQPGLEKVFKDFSTGASKSGPALESQTPTSMRSRTSSVSSNTNSNSSSRGTAKRRARNISISGHSVLADEENSMRQTLETAVNASIDLFQLVDKQQLSHLGTTTDLTGPTVERLIEKYVTEQVHDSVLFPRLKTVHLKDDQDLGNSIHSMSDIDIAQVGIEIEGGRNGKRQLLVRLNLAIEEFRKLSTSSSPQEMLAILLETQKILSGSSKKQVTSGLTSLSEKTSPMNADTLVSLLLLIVVRSRVYHLQARLAYMRNFIFIDDIESGELGYALSTYEAVLQYIATDSGGLRVASRRNRRLWLATKKGDLAEMRTILEPDSDSLSDDMGSFQENEMSNDDTGSQRLTNGFYGQYASSFDKQQCDGQSVASAASERWLGSSDANLDHVFPFQITENGQPQVQRPKAIKRVSLDVQSLSGRSEHSFRSYTDTLNSRTSMIEGDNSIETLCQSEDESGNSVLMMAIESRQTHALDYLLFLEDLFLKEAVLDDTNQDGTTLLSAATQTANARVIEVFANYIFLATDAEGIKTYLTKADTMGRTAAHYLFNAPHLISTFGTLLPWRQKDKNGQTPLLALCRSYDHPHYLDMVNEALQFAVDEQGDGRPLHLDHHVDNKGNTLLHAVTDSYLALRILQQCDADPNSVNYKQFTPLMMASKYGRFELVRTFFLDPRVDTQMREYRGMTAAELAKDEEVRNRIDDLDLVSNHPMPDGRVTAIVRSFFVEDGSIRLIIKTATQSGDGFVAVTTCRRSLTDFEHLVRWLALEHPASWLPSIFNFRSPFQIPSKPSKAVLHDTQLRLNRFLQVMLGHSTFGSHELLWEFILMPEILPDMMADRSRRKSELRQEKIMEESTPISDVRDVDIFVSHARETIRTLNHTSKTLARRVNNIRNSSRDLYTAMDITIGPLKTFSDIPAQHIAAFSRYVKANLPAASDPFAALQISLMSINSTILSILSSLSRPHALIDTLLTSQKALERHTLTVRRAKSNRLTERSVWASALPIGSLLEDNRQHQAKEAQEKLQKAREEVYQTGCDLSYTYQTVASELSSWHEQHQKLVGQTVRQFARNMVIKEKNRLSAMEQALRMARQAGNSHMSASATKQSRSK